MNVHAILHCYTCCLDTSNSVERDCTDCTSNQIDSVTLTDASNAIVDATELVDSAFAVESPILAYSTADSTAGGSGSTVLVNPVILNSIWLSDPLLLCEGDSTKADPAASETDKVSLEASGSSKAGQSVSG